MIYGIRPQPDIRNCLDQRDCSYHSTPNIEHPCYSVCDRQVSNRSRNQKPFDHLLLHSRITGNNWSHTSRYFHDDASRLVLLQFQLESSLLLGTNAEKCCWLHDDYSRLHYGLNNLNMRIPKFCREIFPKIFRYRVSRTWHIFSKWASKWESLGNPHVERGNPVRTNLICGYKWKIVNCSKCKLYTLRIGIAVSNLISLRK